MKNLISKIKPHYDSSSPLLEQLQKLTFEGILTATEYWWMYGQIASPAKYTDILAALSTPTST